jgi:hypothetical protein
MAEQKIIRMFSAEAKALEDTRSVIVTISTQVIGAAELVQAVRRSQQIVSRGFSQALEATAAKGEFMAKQEAPIEHGVLRDSINTQGPR